MRFGQKEVKLAAAAKIPPRTSFESSFNLYQGLRRGNNDDGRQVMHIGSLLVAHRRAYTDKGEQDQSCHDGKDVSNRLWERRGTTEKSTPAHGRFMVFVI